MSNVPRLAKRIDPVHQWDTKFDNMKLFSYYFDNSKFFRFSTTKANIQFVHHQLILLCTTQKQYILQHCAVLPGTDHLLKKI